MAKKTEDICGVPHSWGIDLAYTIIILCVLGCALATIITIISFVIGEIW